jgi:hypothetical protein
MSAYIEKIKYAIPLVEKLEAKYPGIKDDPNLYDLIYTGLRAMPRVQTVVKQNYVRELINKVKSKVKSRSVTKKNWKEEDYDDIEFYTNPFEA